MANIQFTSQLERFLSVPASRAAGGSLGEALEGAMQENPRLRSYVFDDQGRLRQHVAVFVDGVLIQGEVVVSGERIKPKLSKINPAQGLKRLFSAETGQVEALLLDNGYLTDVRTAAAGAVAARHLARAEAESAAILGTGMQARM